MLVPSPVSFGATVVQMPSGYIGSATTAQR